MEDGRSQPSSSSRTRSRIGCALPKARAPFRTFRFRAHARCASDASASQAASPGMVRCAAESRSGLSCGDATGTDTMPQTITVDCPPVPMGAATVSASALALHLDCSRAYIGKLKAEGVIQRQGDGFSLDQSRVAYLRYLRCERRQSPRTEADARMPKQRPNCYRSGSWKSSALWCGVTRSMN
jgi:hypothetical protein